ncbi:MULTISPECIES: hypothetical protein [Luteimonas]|uniref:hypothetical protein n=1 Tax=Luteimonas cellulosilyticus TaxID=2683586 RepID=UPI0018ECB2BE
MIALEWETLGGDTASGLVTERARVLGGWLVRSRGESASIETIAVALAFVPDTHAAWDGAED